MLDFRWILDRVEPFDSAALQKKDFINFIQSNSDLLRTQLDQNPDWIERAESSDVLYFTVCDYRCKHLPKEFVPRKEDNIRLILLGTDKVPTISINLF